MAITDYYKKVQGIDRVHIFMDHVARRFKAVAKVDGDSCLTQQRILSQAEHVSKKTISQRPESTSTCSFERDR